MTQPLDGLKVLDFTTLLPGPLATLMLAEAGASVTKIERPGGEDMHRFAPFRHGVSVLHKMLNRGKQIVEIDLKQPDAMEQLQPYLTEADIVVEQFRPGVMDRLGLSYETLATLYPGLIYCSISGYGQTGPRAGEAGHDLNYQALTGLLAQSCGTVDRPSLPPAQIADIGGGSFPAVTNILLAVLQRQKTGKGCHLDISMADAMFTYGLFAHAARTAGADVPEFGRGLLTGGSPRYRLYPAADGQLIAVAALEDRFWQAFCQVINLPVTDHDDRADPTATMAAVACILRQKPASDWAPIFSAANCCVCLVTSFDQAYADSHFEERGLFDEKIALDASSIDAAVVPIAPQFRKRR